MVPNYLLLPAPFSMYDRYIHTCVQRDTVLCKVCPFKGGICSMLSYGQTGSGKTFTMSGLLNLMAEDLFNHEDVKNGEILKKSAVVEAQRQPSTVHGLNFLFDF